MKKFLFCLFVLVSNVIFPMEKHKVDESIGNESSLDASGSFEESIEVELKPVINFVNDFLAAYSLGGTKALDELEKSYGSFKALINTRDGNGDSLLDRALEDSDIKLFMYVLSKGGHVDLPNEFGNSFRKLAAADSQFSSFIKRNDFQGSALLLFKRFIRHGATFEEIEVAVRALESQNFWSHEDTLTLLVKICERETEKYKKTIDLAQRLHAAFGRVVSDEGELKSPYSPKLEARRRLSFEGDGPEEAELSEVKEPDGDPSVAQSAAPQIAAPQVQALHSHNGAHREAEALPVVEESALQPSGPAQSTEKPSAQTSVQVHQENGSRIPTGVMLALTAAGAVGITLLVQHILGNGPADV
jgi:hypothetical protein